MNENTAFVIVVIALAAAVTVTLWHAEEVARDMASKGYCSVLDSNERVWRPCTSLPAPPQEDK
jgi:hypothetical protein